MPIYGILSYSNSYGSEGGMTDAGFYQLTSLDEAIVVGHENALNLLDSYSMFDFNFRDNAIGRGYEEGTDEFDDYIKTLELEEASWEIYEISLTCPYSLKELNNHSVDFDGICNTYGYLVNV